MITRLEISGFKTFNDFDLEFSPFTVIAGPNGSGKSNLFDAIQLLGRIAESDLQTAFLNQRGDSQELFTLRADGTHAQEMKFAVELLIDKKISDKFGGEDTLKYTRLRYELRIQRARDKRNLERLTVAQEKLEPIPRAEDGWFSRYISTSNALHWRPTTHGGARPFIDTVETDGKLEIFMRQDGGSRRGRPSPALGTEQTVLSSVSKIDFLHVFAVKQEMISWRFLQLNPVELRKPSPLLAKDVVAVDGSNLPAALARMQAEDEQHLVMSDLSHEIHQLLPGIRQLELDFDEPRQQHVLYAIMTDGRRFSSRVLSEGTLRLLALCAFKYDTQYNGVLCFEEPENGVHPYRLRNIVRLLSGLSTDFDDVPADVNSPASLRQLLINTHSPGLLASLVAIQPFPFTAHFASLVTRIKPGQPSSQCTEMRTINFNLDQHQQISLDFGTEKTSEVQAYSLREVITYLQSHDVQDALQLLTDQPVFAS